MIEANEKWLSGPGVPKLFVNADPGAIVGDRVRERVRSWPSQREVTVRGVHFVQEDSGQAIGEAIADWLASL